MKLQLDNGATVEVLEPPVGQTVKVKYIDSLLWPVPEGTEETIEARVVFGIYTGDDTGAVRAIVADKDSTKAHPQVDRPYATGGARGDI
jgi:hypothetical protein